ncbi:MAG: hypothetical protein PHG91_14205 [Syntrophales bacterium]|jgi:hypothetical protein|nr:hypothetical protein [Syntrophales bacterium]
MAITVTTPAVAPGQRGTGFILNGVSADASGCEELKAAPAAGKSIHITHLTLNNGANAISHTIGEGETTPGSADTALIGPIAMAANTSLQWDFNPPMKLTAATSLVIDSSGAGAVCVFAEGYVE